MLPHPSNLRLRATYLGLIAVVLIIDVTWEPAARWIKAACAGLILLTALDLLGYANRIGAYLGNGPGLQATPRRAAKRMSQLSTAILLSVAAMIVLALGLYLIAWRTLP